MARIMRENSEVREPVTQRDPEMHGHVEALVQLLDVLPAQAENHFMGLRKPGGVGRVFGGQVVAQAMMAAGKTVAEDRPIHSLHCYFMRPGSEDHEIDFAVDADMDGRAFSNRRVVARQQGKALFNMIASFHRPERGPHHQAAMPDVPPPEALGDFAESVRAHPELVGPAIRRLLLRPGPVEFRPTTALTRAHLSGPRPALAQSWLRFGAGPLGLPQSLQRACLAWVSDMLLLASAFRPHGLQIGAASIQGASLDHAMWFHGDVECGDWLLYVTDSPWSGDGRGLANGHFFARDGRLVASVAQEGLMRFVQEA